MIPYSPYYHPLIAAEARPTASDQPFPETTSLAMEKTS